MGTPVINRKTKLKLRRQYRSSRRQVEDIGQQAEYVVERHFFKRLGRLWDVRRFVAGWVLLLVLLSGGVLAQTADLSSYYQELRPAPGGIFSEGMVGSFTNANPLYATGSVDGAVSRLVFSGLFKYDQSNQLQGNLAEKYEADERGNTYTVTLRTGLLWHDGKPLTARDVEFTYQLIQNPDAKSPLSASWGDIKVRAVDDVTVTFTLPNALSAFPHSMTNGIVPRHILDGVPMAQLRSIDFNTIAPIGSGPFKLDEIEVSGAKQDERTQNIALVPNGNYHFGRPKLNRFVFKIYADEQRLKENFIDKKIDAVGGLESIPDELKHSTELRSYNVPLTGGVYAFFNTSAGVLKNGDIRRALTKAVNTSTVISSLGYPVVPLRGPLLSEHTAYNGSLVQFKQDIKAANKLLDGAGWKMQNDGIRGKDGKPLVFSISAQDTPEYQRVAEALRIQWLAVGVQVKIVPLSDTDLKTALVAHNYDALLHGISLGVDPDVFAFWHSSQADARSMSRLNFSEYQSQAADQALEAGRTRDDPKLRAIKYEPFLKAWRQDAPAIALYQPRFLYLTHTQIFGFDPNTFNNNLDRFRNVHNWQIRQQKVNK